MTRSIAPFFLAGPLFAVACNESTPAARPAASAAPKAPVATALLAPKDSITPEVREVFKSRCAVCHGETGKGDGVGSAALNPKPRDYTDKVWQAKVSDEDIRKVIHYGGAAVGKSPMMPANPDLEAKPALVNGLIGVIREFGAK